MSKKNLHIKKYLSGKLPEPEVQPDDAWGQMNDMLGESPVPDAKVSTADKMTYLLKSGLGIIAGLGIAALIWHLVPKENKDIIKQKAESSLNNPVLVQNLPDQAQKELITDLENYKIDSLQQFPTSAESQDERKSAMKDAEKLIVKDNSAAVSKKYTASEASHLDNKHSKKQTHNSIDQSKNEFTKSASLKQRSNFTNHNRPGSLNNQRNYKPKDAGNKPGFQSGKANYISESKVIFSVKSLIPKSFHFNDLAKNLNRQVSYNKPVSPQKIKVRRDKKPLFETLHAGLEWNAASSLNSTKYVLKGTDSTSKPYLLLIPGIWLSKDIAGNQSITLSFYASQPYYGGSRRIQRLGADSLLFHNNINLIKASGVNLALQYDYHFLSKMAVSAGFSYSPVRRALAQDDYENYQGIILPGPKLLLNKQNISQYMNTNLFMLKTGLTFTPGRYQFGINMLIPLSNLSLTSTSIPKTLNGQFFFRFRIK